MNPLTIVCKMKERIWKEKQKASGARCQGVPDPNTQPFLKGILLSSTKGGLSSTEPKPEGWHKEKKNVDGTAARTCLQQTGARVTILVFY